MTEENDIQKEIMNYLKRHHRVGMVWRQNVGRKGHIKFGVPGQSDIMGILKGGRFFSIEVKVPGKNPTETQRRFIQEVVGCGGAATWVDSLDGAKKFIDSVSL